MIKLSLKTKIYLGFGFLSAMIILLWLVGTIFIYSLSGRSAAMLSENYQSVESAEYLIKSIDEIRNWQLEEIFHYKNAGDTGLLDSEIEKFESNLVAVETNVTEKGEKDIVDNLKKEYGIYRNQMHKLSIDSSISEEYYFTDILPQYRKVRDLIISLSDINRNAIIFKNNSLNNTAHNAFIVLSLIGLVFFIIAASFSFRYPSSIIKPVKQLTLGIKEIANRNYEQKLDYQSNDELGELAMAFNTMSLKLNEYEHSNLSELLFEKKRTETIINNMKDAIIGVNERHEIIFSNMVACRLLDIGSSDIVGKTVKEAALQNSLLKEILPDTTFLSSDEMREFSSVKIAKSGKTLYYSKDILTVLLTRTGEEKPIPAGFVIILKNITKYLEQDEAKTNFIATISHQLKNPISSIRLNLKLLDDSRIGELNSEQKEIVEALKDESGKMIGITSELLDLAQVETGNIQLNMQSVFPEQIIDYVKESSIRHAGNKNVQLEFVAPASLSPFYGDSEKTAWVLINLINNAIQYSEINGKVKVLISELSDYIEFCVEDQGKGIEDIYLTKIFEKYFRVPGSIEKGTGLGLSISKEFICKQKGEIWAESKVNQGSRFYFRLPIFKLKKQDQLYES